MEWEVSAKGVKGEAIHLFVERVNACEQCEVKGAVVNAAVSLVGAAPGDVAMAIEAHGNEECGMVAWSVEPNPVGLVSAGGAPDGTGNTA